MTADTFFIMPITVYHYSKCSTCRKALKWLAANGIAVTAIDIVQSPPSAKVLRAAANTAGLPLTKFFNTSGESYRSGDYKTKLPQMTDEEKLAALAADGKLIKRPLLIGDDFVLVGFNEDAYAALFGG